MKNLQNQNHRVLLAYQEAKAEYAHCTARILDLQTRLEVARAELAQAEQASALATAALHDPLGYATTLGQAINRVWDADARVISCQTQVEILEDAMTAARATTQSARWRVQQAERAVSQVQLLPDSDIPPASWGAKLGGIRTALINLANSTRRFTG